MRSKYYLPRLQSMKIYYCCWQEKLFSQFSFSNANVNWIWSSILSSSLLRVWRLDVWQSCYCKQGRKTTYNCCKTQVRKLKRNTNDLFFLKIWIYCKNFTNIKFGSKSTTLPAKDPWLMWLLVLAKSRVNQKSC